MEVLHRTSKWSEVRRLACPLRRFPFAAPPNCGGSPAKRARGNAFPTPAGRLYGFRRQRRHKKWRRRRRTSPAQRYYITPEGKSPQPVREASADPGQNPWRPGPKGPAAPSTLAAKPCQPSGILESIAPVPVPISTAPQALQTLEPSHRKVRQTSAAKRLSNRCPQKRAVLTCSFLP